MDEQKNIAKYCKCTKMFDLWWNCGTVEALFNKGANMLTKIVNWQTEDGCVFPTEEEANAHQEYLAKIELIEEVLKVDCDMAIEIEDFIKKYTKGWK